MSSEWRRRRLQEIDAELRRHGIDPESSPYERPEIEGIPLPKESVEAIRRILEEYATAREKVGPGEFVYTDDSPFPIPPRD